VRRISARGTEDALFQNGKKTPTPVLVVVEISPNHYMPSESFKQKSKGVSSFSDFLVRDFLIPR
jgi:hypothetical protein